MNRRPTRLSVAAVGGAIALMSMSAAPAFAQDGPGEMPAGGWTSYPDHGTVDCEAGTFNDLPYGGQIASIEAVDDMTVQFNLCRPDASFLQKIAFSAFPINDADYLAANMPDGTIVDNPNGTGPYSLGEWRRGSEVIFTANPDYWGEAPLSETAVLRWSSEPGQKLIELQSGQVDGVDNPSSDDIDIIEQDGNLVVVPREPINIFYVGMNNTYEPFNNEKVRQALAMGINRQQIVDQFYSDGSAVADYFTPCSFDYACGGEPWYEFDPEAAQALLAEGLAELGLEEFPETQIHLRVVDRSYLPFPQQVAVDIQDQLSENLGITATIDEQESGTFIDNSDAGNLPGLHLLGWNADYPDPTNFKDYHFGAGASDQFGEGWPDVHEALLLGASNADPEVRTQAYTDANNAIRQHVPMIPIARGASSTAWAADVENPQSSPLSNELFYAIGGGADGTLVFMQSGEPIGLFCADESDGESLRACEQVNESLYGFEIDAATVEPTLATECTANEDSTVWTCALREGVTFHDGSTFEAADVVTSYAVSWDAANPLHIGRDGSFTYFPALWGGLLPAAEAAE